MKVIPSLNFISINLNCIINYQASELKKNNRDQEIIQMRIFIHLEAGQTGTGQTLVNRNGRGRQVCG